MSETETKKPDDDGTGVQIDLISKQKLDGMATMEKIRTILDGVKNHNIIILEQGLTPDEESRLVEVTMSEIDPDGFSGIEIETYPSDNDEPHGFIRKLSSSLGRKQEKTRSMTVICPSDELETIHKDESLIQLVKRR